MSEDPRPNTAGDTIPPEVMLRGRIELLQAQFPFVLLGNALVPTIAAWFLRARVEYEQLALWVSAIWVVALLRWLVGRRLADAPETPRSQRLRLLVFVLGSLLSGLLWGSSAWFLLDLADPVYTSLIILMLAGMTAGAVPSLSAHAVAYFAYAVPTMLPVTLLLLGEGADAVPAGGLFMLLFLIVNLGYSLRLHRKYGETIAYRYENAQLVDRLRRQMQIAQEADVAKSRFLAAASHDLRQPLYAMGLFLDALSQTPQQPQQQMLLQRVRQSLEALRQLFDALLDISRLDAGAMEVSIRVVDLDILLQDLYDEFEPQAAKKGLELRIDDEAPLVMTDPLLLERMLRNLLSNALRYTEQGKIHLAWEQVDDRVWLSVADTGQGIAEDDQQRIFDEFQQVGNPGRDRRRGLGLGLAIVRRLSNLLDHPLRLNSAPGQGSRFALELPVAPDDEIFEESLEPASLHTPWVGDVLVVDDESDVLDAVAEVLRGWGMRVRCAGDEDEAMALIEKGFRPQLLITDYRLPRGPVGLELIDRMREVLGHRLGALLITGDTAPEELARIHAHGTPVLNKPVGAAGLRQAIDREMETHAA
ncbi:hybrid sensor histidine kinase/response regulator [endosymbiont of unidentified scaly snail isolate Monju]|uniref:hybrid sensor histidine kinase/response regulator n=1 Tax=endosymbiont of unidentified scaly snail isolate Monju TaxID=1248727 RepID=UPI00038928DA|nr:hybrid sensor histidine kinase/response regulator [endosymbiont of unidentified scaly snail isolate Monju]BAN68241.1 two-component system hybrid sensor histidine kinase and response regulator [endosymbiont of unidentified scaly snail isolate Monju]